MQASTVSEMLAIQCLILTIYVQVMQYNVRNGVIRWQISNLYHACLH